MEIIKISKENNEFSADIKFFGEQWDKAFKKQYEEAAKSIKIEGFRPGKAPADIVKKYINESDIALKTVFKMENNLFAILNANEEYIKEKDELNTNPKFDIIELSKKTSTVQLAYSYLPKVSNDYDYKNISLYETKSEEITDEQVNEELTRFQEGNAKIVESKETVLANGHIATFDFTGFKDGEEFPGGKATNYDLEIGSNQFIPGFEEQMVGMEVGSEKDINVTFPAEYHAEDLAGKPVVFKVKLHAIKEVSTPKLDDETVKGLGIPNVETLAELKEHIKTYLQERVSTANKELVLKSVMKDFEAKGETSKIAADVIDTELDKYINQIKQNAQMQGFKLEDILKMSNTTEEDFKKSKINEAVYKIKTDALIKYVASKENLVTTEEDFEKEAEKLSKIYGVEVDIVKQRLAFNKKEIMKEILVEKVIDRLYELNKNNKKLEMNAHDHDHDHEECCECECDCGCDH